LISENVNILVLIQ